MVISWWIGACCYSRSWILSRGGVCDLLNGRLIRLGCCCPIDIDKLVWMDCTRSSSTNDLVLVWVVRYFVIVSLIILYTFSTLCLVAMLMMTGWIICGLLMTINYCNRVVIINVIRILITFGQSMRWTPS